MKVILKESGLYQETTELLDFNTSGSLKTHGAVASSGSITAGTLTSTGSVNGATLAVSTTSVLTGDVTFGGHIVGDADESKNIFAATTTGTNLITIGGGGTVVAGGDLRLATAGVIEDSNGDARFTATNAGATIIGAADGTAGITLAANNSDVTVAGDLVVSGGKITLTNGSLIDSETGGELQLTEDLVVCTGDIKIEGNGIQDNGGDERISLADAMVLKDADGTAVVTLHASDLSTTFAGDATVTGDLTVTGNDLDFGNGATIVNTDANTLTITEATVALSGDLTVNGNDLDFASGNANIGASIGANTLSLGGSTSTVKVLGDFEVAGTINSVNTTVADLLVEDHGLVVASGSLNAAAADGAGLYVGHKSGSIASFVYDSDNDRMKLNNAGLYVQATATFDGDVDLGNATSDTITATGRFDSALIASADSAQDLGASGTAWANLYVDAIDLNGQGSISMGGTGRIDLDADDDTSIRASADDVITFEAGAVDVMAVKSTGLHIIDDTKLFFGNGDDASFEYDEDGNDVLSYDGANMRFNAAVELEFRAASQFISSTNANILAIGSGQMLAFSSDIVSFMGTGGTDVDAKVRINGATTSYGLNLPNTSTTGDAIANSWSTYSDATLKKDITPIENALEKVMSMKGVSYEYKSGGGRKVGFLAQDMQSVVPEVVKSMQQEDNKDLLCISYDQLTSVLVEAVKAQQAQIEDLKSVVVKLSDNS